MVDQIYQERNDINLENRFRMNDIVMSIFRLALSEEELEKLSEPPRPNVYYMLTARISTVYKTLNSQSPEGWDVLKLPQKSYLDQRSVELILDQLVIKNHKDKRMRAQLSKIGKHGIELNQVTIEQIKEFLFKESYRKPLEM